MVHVGRAADAHRLRLEPRALERGERLGDPGAGARDLALLRIDHQPAEGDAARVGDALGERHRLIGALHAAATGAGVALDEKLDPHAGFACRARHRIGDLGRIRHSAHADALGERRQALELCFADDREGHQDVGNAAIRHDLGFTELLAGDADRAELDLAARELDDLMRLDVRAKRDLLLGEVIGGTLEIALDPVEIDDRGRRVDVVDAHRRSFHPHLLFEPGHRPIEPLEHLVDLGLR